MVSDARNRLRSMGGIMASSPELMQAAGLQGAAAVVPVVPSVMDETQVPLSDQTFFSELQMGSSAGRRENRPGPDYAVEDLADAAPGSRARGQLEPVPATAQELEGRAEELEESAGRLSQNRGGRVARDRMLTEAEDLRAQAADLPGGARSRAQLELQRVMPGGMRVGEEDPKILADTKMEESREARAAAQRQLQETAPEELLTIGGKLATLEQLAPPPEDNDNTPSAKRTLRERYEQRLELFKDIFGESDEARARDRAMSLAMLGLAIASGQSPNALTNIAQGAMAGVQGMSEQEQARREREEGIKTMALQTAIDEMSAADRAEAEAAESQLEFERDVDLKLLEQGAGGGASRFNKDDTPADVYREVFQTLSSVMSVEEARQRALEQANNHLVLVRPRLTEEQFAAELRGLQALSGAQAPAPTPDQRIKELREQGVSDEQIKQGFQAAFPELDPSDYGL